MSIKLWARGSKNTLKLAPKMSGILIQDCTQYPFETTVISIGNDLYIQGSDSLGVFAMIGSVSGTDV